MTHIVINAFSAKRGGGITYLNNFLDNITSQDGFRISVLCYSSQKFEKINTQARYIKFNNLFSNPVVTRIWEAFCLRYFLNIIKTDVYFSPGGIIDYSLNKSHFKKVVMFRNMIPFDESQKKKWPFGYTKIRNFLLSRILLKSMKIADLVIFISKHGKDIILKKTNGNLNKCVLINHGVSKIFRKNTVLPTEEIRDQFDSDYILYPSIIDVYKSQKEVVMAYEKLLREEIELPKLFLVGEEYGKYSRDLRKYIINNGLSNHIILPGPVDHIFMPYIYKKSRFVIYASQSENCPNILLEAMASGKAILCSNFNPMPEFGGKAVEYFDPSNIHDIAEKIKSFLNRDELVKQLEEMSLEESKNYDWSTTTDKTLKSILNI